MGGMSVVLFVLMLGFWGEGGPYLGRSLMWGQVVLAGCQSQFFTHSSASYIVPPQARAVFCVGQRPTVPSLCFSPQYDYSFRTEQSAAARLPPSPTRCPPLPPS